jgi:predicted nucleic acid-binding Zn ribbon protein
MAEVPTPNDRPQIYSDTRPALRGSFLLEAALTTTTQTERLAAALLADRNRKTIERTDIGACFTCARGVIYRGSRFCSDRCRDYYDTGAPGCEQDWRQPDIAYAYLDGRPMAKGVHGFKINCAHCAKEFDSRGLRCCSTECERGYREREQNRATLAEVGVGLKGEASLRTMRHEYLHVAQRPEGVQISPVLLPQVPRQGFAGRRIDLRRETIKKPA